MQVFNCFSSAKRQSGFGIIQVMIAILVAGVLAALSAGKWIQAVNDSAAEGTASYLLMVRGAVQDGLATNYDALSLTNTSGAPAGTIPTPPAWAVFAGNTTTVSVDQLKASGLLADGFGNAPPLGRSVHVRLIRASCPGANCSVRAYVYTCWPISKAVAPGAIDNNVCPAAPGGWEFDPNLVGKVIESTKGFGGSNTSDQTRVRGSLFNFLATDLGIPAGSRGHVVVDASLESTSFNQFVRQGDTRHIQLNNALSVAGAIDTSQGLLLKTNVAPGSACSQEMMYATSNRWSFVQCNTGRWFEINNHTLMSVQSLPNGSVVVPPVCPTGSMYPFVYATLQQADVTMTGGDVNVRGNMSGTITGSGQTSMTGSVSVSGTYSGTTQSASDSSIRVTQGVVMSGNTVVITPATAGARALVFQGCRYP